MRLLTLIALAGILALTSSALQAADVKPVVVNPSTGLNTVIQPTMRLSVPTASGGFLVTLDPGVQIGTQVFTFPIVAGGQTLAILGAQTFTGEQTLPASTTGTAPLNIPQGSAPTSPVNGDVWTTVAGLFARINGTTVGPFAAATGSSFPVSTTTYAVQDSGDATKQQKWNLASSTTGTILTLKGQQSTSQTLAFPNVTGSDTLATLGLANIFAAKNTFPASTTSAASINLPAGTAPSSPVDGDMWTTTAGVFARISGTTVGPFSTGGGLTGSLTSGRVPFASGASTLTDSAIMTFSTANGFSVNKATAFRSEFFGFLAGNNTLTGTNLTVVGGSTAEALTSGTSDTVVGSQAASALSSGNKIVMVGDNTGQTLSTGTSDILLGSLTDTDTAGRSNAFVAGSVNGTNIADVWFGNGIAAPSPLAYLIHGTAGSGTDITGGSITLAGGQGTGAGLGGPITFQTALATTTGTGANSLVEVARVTQGKNVLVGTTSDITGTFGLAVAGTTDASSSTTGAVQIGGGVGIAKKLYVGTEVFTPASTTTNAGITLPHGSAPSAPTNGDFWSTTAGFFGRVNGSTVGPFAAAPVASWPVSTTTYAVQDSSDATKQQLWNLASASTGTNLTLKGQQSTSQTLAFPNVTTSDTVATLGVANFFTPPAVTAVNPPTHFSYVNPADTSLTNGTVGLPDVLFDLSATKQWGGSTSVVGYKAFDIKAPVLSSTTATTTFTGPATLVIEGPPTAGANATASGGIAVLVNAGNMTVNAGTLTLKGAPSNVVITQTAASSAVAQSFSLTGAAHTNQTASTEELNVRFNLGQTVQHATGALTTQRAMVVDAPTYSFVGASTLTDTATFAVTGAPAAGTNATFTDQPSAIWAQAGQIRAGGNFMADPASAPAILQDGQFWQDSTQQSLTSRQKGASLPLSGTIFAATATGTCTTTTTETSIVGTGVGTKTLPANFLVAGKTVRVLVSGIVSNAVTDGLRIKVKAGSTVLLDTGSTVAIVGTLTNARFIVSGTFTCRTTGASGTVFANGNVSYDNGTTAQANGLTNTAATTLDTTVTEVIDCTATWSTASASDSISGQVVTFEVLN